MKAAIEETGYGRDGLQLIACGRQPGSLKISKGHICKGFLSGL
jgi:hypothetical protein